MSGYVGYTTCQIGAKALLSDVLFGGIVLGAARRWGGRGALLLTHLPRKVGEAYASVGLAVGAGVFATAQAVGEAVMPDTLKPYLKFASLGIAAIAFHEAGKAGAKSIANKTVTLVDAAKITSPGLAVAAILFKMVS